MWILMVVFLYNTQKQNKAQKKKDEGAVNEFTSFPRPRPQAFLKIKNWTKNVSGGSAYQ